MKQKFQSILGERAGTRAYNTITRKNQLLTRSREIFGKELKKKFKGVKNIELLFRTVEATLTTRKDGTPVFGTRDVLVVEDGRIEEYMDSGWQKHEDQEGIEN